MKSLQTTYLLANQKIYCCIIRVALHIGYAAIKEAFFALDIKIGIGAREELKQI